MAVQPNLVIGAVGAAIAILTGAYIYSNWTDLTGLEDYEASFTRLHSDFEPRQGTVAPGSTREEVFLFPRENVTRLSVYLTWQDGLTSMPEIELQVKDPRNETRVTQRHVGGVSGIRFDLVLIKDSPSGRHSFQARGHDAALQEFQERWPSHPEARGNWTFAIRAPAASGPPSPIPYTLRVGYDAYEGSFVRIDAPTR